MEIVSTVVSIISCLCPPNCLHEPLGSQFNYLRRHHDKAKKLENKMEDLSVRATNIRRKLNEANVQEGKEPKADVALWVKRVQKIESEVHSLMKKVGERQRCLNGCFPNYCSRLKLGKQIKKSTEMVTELLDQGQFSDDQLTDLQQEKGKPLSTTTLVGKTTAERNFEKIWEYIMDDNIGKIGVYGMGGVGKTTIMQNIHNHLLKESTYFDKVIWITVSKDSNLVKLQNDLGKELNLDLKNYENETSRASQLLAALKRRKRFMLILDDMWKTFPLEKIGIPNPTRENGCKLVLTTRLQGVCRGMETQKNVEVRVLNEEEAWDLFKDKVGEAVLLSSDIKTLAKAVARECDGLPLALITVGRALRQVEDIMVWKNALNELRASIGDIEGLEDQVFKSLRFSYARLRNDQIRACFLYCALYPEDHIIEVKDLVEHWIGEGLIDGLELREDQICKGITILNELKCACMLENSYDGRGKACVKLHDLIRDLAIRIQSPTCIIKAGFSLTKAPKDEEWIKEVKRVSLMRNNLEQIMGEPKCPKLYSLLLQHNPLMNISPLFFHHMFNLRVVNLSFTNIDSLPKSLTDLKNLRVLLLSNCEDLKNLPSIENLKSLRTLDISNSSITELPPGMQMLVNLRRLDLWYCELRMFPTKLLEELTLLEELSVGGEIFQWGSVTVKGARGGACAKELISATHLRNLQVYFFNSKNFHSYIKSGHWQQLTSFTLTVGAILAEKPSEFGKNLISINNIDFIVGGTCLVLPDTTHVLKMEWCNIRRLSMCLSNSAQLKQCFLKSCSDMECILMAGESNLPWLEKMMLQNLPNLRCLCKGIVAPATLSCLKVLYVYNCNKLKNLFTHGLLQYHLQSLEEISVYDCDEMKEIVVKEKDDYNNGASNSIIALPSLKELWLRSLPNLNSICKGIMVCNSLHTIFVDGCEKLKKLPIVSVENGEISAPPAVRKIIGNKNWWDPLTSDHPEAHLFFQPFRING